MSGSWWTWIFPELSAVNEMETPTSRTVLFNLQVLYTRFSSATLRSGTFPGDTAASSRDFTANHPIREEQWLRRKAARLLESQVQVQVSTGVKLNLNWFKAILSGTEFLSRNAPILKLVSDIGANQGKYIVSNIGCTEELPDSAFNVFNTQLSPTLTLKGL